MLAWGQPAVLAGPVAGDPVLAAQLRDRSLIAVTICAALNRVTTFDYGIFSLRRPVSQSISARVPADRSRELAEGSSPRTRSAHGSSKRTEMTGSVPDEGGSPPPVGKRSLAKAAAWLSRDRHGTQEVFGFVRVRQACSMPRCPSVPSAIFSWLHHGGGSTGPLSSSTSDAGRTADGRCARSSLGRRHHVRVDMVWVLVPRDGCLRHSAWSHHLSVPGS